MAVLSTLLHVLLIIGKVLLVIVLAVLAIILLLILAPYCYKVQVKADKEHFRADGGLSWLWFVARLRFHLQDNEKDFEVYLLGIPVMRMLRFIKGRKKEKNREQTEPAGKASGSTEQSTPETMNAAEVKEQKIPEEKTAELIIEQKTAVESTESEEKQEAESVSHNFSDRRDTIAESREPVPEQKTDVNQKTPPEQRAEAKRQRAAAREQKRAAREEKREMRKNAHRQKTEAKRSGKRSGSGKIKTVLEKVRWGMQLIRTEMFQEAFGAVKTGGLRVLKHIVPRRIKGFIRFGLNDPARTGQVCGILALLYPKMPEKLEVIPDFQEACFEADTVIKGRVFLIYLIVQGVKIILNKNVRLLIKVVRNKVPLEKVIAAENRRSGGNKNGK